MKNIGLLLVYMWLSVAFTQHYNFIPYGVSDGIAQSQVTDICQDKFGNLWVATQSGLSRFDSKSFVNFSMDDGLADNVISKVIISPDELIWVLTPRGISKYQNGKFKSFYFDDNERINDAVFYKGSLIIATNQSLFEFSDSSFSVIHSSEQKDLRFRSLQVLNKDVLLCATNQGLYKFEDGMMDRFKLAGVEDLNLSDVKLRSNELIIGTIKEGIIVYDLESNTSTNYLIDGIPVRSLFVDEVSIWAASKFGVVEIRNGKENFYTEKNGLSINSTKVVFKDMESNIWIGTYGKGLLKFTGYAITGFSTRDGLSSDIVMSIAQFKNSDFAFGTYDKGLNILKSDKSVEVIQTDNGLKRNSVWVTYVDRENRCWVGTSGGLQCTSKGVFIEKQITSKVNKKIRSIVQFKESIFFAGSGGLWIYQGDSLQQLNNTIEYNINKIVVSDSTLYLATRNGFYYQKLNSLSRPFKKVVLPEMNINTIALDKFGNVWVGTINGLYILSSSGPHEIFDLDKNNYKSKNIMGVIKDRQNRMWISTTHGLYMALNTGPNGGFSVINQYTLSEGLLDMESNLNSLYEDFSGNIWLGTSSALVRINPMLNPVLFSFSLPKLSITGIRLFKESFKYDNYKIGNYLETGVPSAMELPYTKNHLTFDFIGVNNKNPDKVFYTYRLLGAEDKWSPITKENSASYSFISPGDYEFQVKSANKNLEWTEVVSVKFSIKPPFWKTWWFIILLACVLSALVYFALSVRISGIKQKKDNERLVSENKLRNLEQQSLNASMNRHFIFNSLNSIQYFINSSDKKSANKYLSNFARLIRKNLDSSTQHNFLVSLSDEIERIELYLTLEKMRFNEKFDYNVTVDLNIDTEMIQVPSMILQPFVENSIIHGVLPKEAKGQINITIKEEIEFIVFEVIDDGVGIDSSLNQKDSFEGDHKSQGMEITANRIDLLRRINGDKLMIIGPFQINKQGKSVGTKVIIKLPAY